MQGVQKVVFDIIKTSRDLGLAFIDIKIIKEEARKTSLAELDDVIPNTKKNAKRTVKKTQLDFSIEQALSILKKKKYIRQTKQGHWTIVKGATKYKPSVCKALQSEYEFYCPKCDKYTYKVVNNISKESKKCPQCNRRLEIQLYRYHCPVRNVYIGDPVKQCELLHGTNINNLTTEVFPMKICYFASKPTKPMLEYAREKVRQEDEKLAKEARYYIDDVRDPLSKHYLPNLEKGE